MLEVVRCHELEFGCQKGQVVAGPGHFGLAGANSEVEDFSYDLSMTKQGRSVNNNNNIIPNQETARTSLEHG